MATKGSFKRAIEKVLWWLYSNKWKTFLLLYIAGFLLLTWLLKSLGIGWNYDIREIIKAILDEDKIKSLPFPVALFITIIVPAALPLAFNIFIEVKLFPAKIPYVLSTLHDRCWEVYELGRIWLRDSTQKIVDKVDGFRTGLWEDPDNISVIVNALYELTRARTIYATWFLDIRNLTQSEMNYIAVTHNNIKRLNKFRFIRFLISDIEFVNLFLTNPLNNNVKWFVNQHLGDRFSLKYVNASIFWHLVHQHLIEKSKTDVLFFDGILALIVELDTTNYQPFVKDGKYQLSISDTNTDKSIYYNFFKSLSEQSVDVLDEIKYNNTFKNMYFPER